MLARIAEMQGQIESEIHRHVSRWQHPRTVGQWRTRVSHMREFAEKRPEEVRKHVAEYFGLPGVAKVRVSLADVDGNADSDGIDRDSEDIDSDGDGNSIDIGGTVLINSVDVREGFAWFGSSLGINMGSHTWSDGGLDRSYDEGDISIGEMVGNDGVAGNLGAAGEWTGIYFKGVPVRIEAFPDEGYEFAGWGVGTEILGNSAVVEVNLEGDLKIRPIFNKVE